MVKGKRKKGGGECLGFCKTKENYKIGEITKLLSSKRNKAPKKKNPLKYLDFAI